MGIFNLFNKSSKQPNLSSGLYADPAINLVYNLLFCDNIELYKANTQQPLSYPYDILYAGTSSVDDLQKIIDDPGSDPRVKMLAYNKQMAVGHKPTKKELLGVIVEVGLDEGLDVLASFPNGTARYINYTGKLLIWETSDPTSEKLISELGRPSADGRKGRKLAISGRSAGGHLPPLR